MRNFFKGLLLLPIKIFGKFIPSLPDSIHDFSTIQRLYLVLSVPYFYFWPLFLLTLSIDGYFGLLLVLFTLMNMFVSPVIFYHGVALIYKGIISLLNFVFAKDADRIKDNFESVSGQINSQLILRYLLILLVIVIIVVILIGAFR